jgi:hypothetical protein
MEPPPLKTWLKRTLFEAFACATKTQAAAAKRNVPSGRGRMIFPCDPMVDQSCSVEPEDDAGMIGRRWRGS